LPFHPMAAGKYESLGRPYAARDLARPSSDQMELLARIAEAQGIAVRAGRV